METAFDSYRTGTADRGYHDEVARTLTDFRRQYDQWHLNNDFSAYEELLRFLKGAENVQLRPVRELAEPVGERVAVALRHDVDIDLEAAVRCARCAARHGVPTTFYLLHTAYYYGRFAGGVFERDAMLPDRIKSLALAGCEIGLHVDPLSIYVSHGIDGAQAVVTELDWLRSLDVTVRGVAAHNSAPLYGAENFEVFEGLALADRKSVQAWGTSATVPLQTLSLQDLGLDYEANYPAPSPSVTPEAVDFIAMNPPNWALNNREMMRTYLVENPGFDRQYDATIWVKGRDDWVIGVHKTRELHWDLSTAEVLRFVQDLSVGEMSRVVMVLHPVFFSRPPRPSEAGAASAQALDDIAERVTGLESSLARCEHRVDSLADLQASIAGAQEAISALDQANTSLRSEVAALREVIERPALWVRLMRAVTGRPRPH